MPASSTLTVSAVSTMQLWTARTYVPHRQLALRRAESGEARQVCPTFCTLTAVNPPPSTSLHQPHHHLTHT